MTGQHSEPESLNDPKTGKCCPKRCGAVVDRVNKSINSLVNQVLGALSERVGRVEEKLSEQCSNCKEKLSERVNEVEKRLNDVYRSVQSSILQRYADLVRRVEETLSQSPTESPSETPEELPSPTETPMESESPSPIIGGSNVQSPSSRGTNTPNKVPQSSTPESNKPQTPQGTYKAHRKRNEDCLEIDWCDDFYVWLDQWQAQMVNVHQQTQEAYRQCCPDTPEGKKLQDENKKNFVIKFDLTTDNPPTDKE